MVIISIKQGDENGQTVEDKYLCEKFVGVGFGTQAFSIGGSKVEKATGNTIMMRGDVTEEDVKEAVGQLVCFPGFDEPV